MRCLFCVLRYLQKMNVIGLAAMFGAVAGSRRSNGNDRFDNINVKAFLLDERARLYAEKFKDPQYAEARPVFLRLRS